MSAVTNVSFRAAIILAAARNGLQPSDSSTSEVSAMPNVSNASEVIS